MEVCKLSRGNFMELNVGTFLRISYFRTFFFFQENISNGGVFYCEFNVILIRIWTLH